MVHLGVQTGVRYSIKNPIAYLQANIVGHVTMLEIGRNRRIEYLVYTSSSSVYGGNDTLSFRVEDRAGQPCHSMQPPEGERVDEQDLRPSISSSADRLRLFTKAILGGPPINVFGEGQMRRDFAYIDNIVAGVIACLGNSSADDCVAKAGGSISPHPI